VRSTCAPIVRRAASISASVTVKRSCSEAVAINVAWMERLVRRGFERVIWKAARILAARAPEVCAFSPHSPQRGERSAGKRGDLAIGPRGGGEPPRHACEACRLLLRSRRRASRRSACGSFRIPGHAFQRALAPPDQPAPGGRSVVTSRWSPGSPESGMSAGRGCRTLPHFQGTPRKAPLRVKGL